MARITIFGATKRKDAMFYLIIIFMSMFLTISIWWWYDNKITDLENEIISNPKMIVR